MTKPNSRNRRFSGMSYREVQISNANRRSKLPKKQQDWLKENGYRNCGWDAVIKLYQKINDLLDQGDEDSPTLEDLFLQAERIGNKYQTQSERDDFNQQLMAEAQAIAEMVDQQFPDTDIEIVDFGERRPRSTSKKRH